MQPLICCINLGQEGTGKGRRVRGKVSKVGNILKNLFVHYRKISMSTLAGGHFSLLVTVPLPLSPSLSLNISLPPLSLSLAVCVCVFLVVTITR